jgi:hypothetical protein
LERKKSRRPLIKTTSYISNKKLRNKMSLSKQKLSKLSLQSLNYVSNKRIFNNKINKNKDNEKVGLLTINSSNKNLQSKLLNLRENKKPKLSNLRKKKSCIFMTENNHKNQYIKLYKNLLSKCISSRNGKNHHIITCFNSYDETQKVLSKSDNKNAINERNQNINDNANYIKVNKKDVNHNKTKEMTASLNCIIDGHINRSFDIKKDIRNVIIHKNKSEKVINNNYNINDNNEKKGLNFANIYDINKSENNIFLDKNYQNRFKQKTKIDNNNNDIFTIEKQREYNTIIVKKKSKYIYNKYTISTSNSSNSSHNHKKNNMNKNEHKNWVHRLYDQEIKKQKIKDKMVFLLRKSILNETTPNESKKVIKKSNRTKEFKYHNFPFDKNFNVIDLFLSDDKKEKNNFKKYGYKKGNFNENNKIKDKERKTNKLIVCRKRNESKRKSKILFLYNEELIHEEDEEKEKDEDE